MVVGPVNLTVFFFMSLFLTNQLFSKRFKLNSRKTGLEVTFSEAFHSSV